MVWPRRVSVVVVVADCCRKAGDFRVLVFLIVGFPGSSTAIALKTLCPGLPIGCPAPSAHPFAPRAQGPGPAPCSTRLVPLSAVRCPGALDSGQVGLIHPQFLIPNPQSTFQTIHRSQNPPPAQSIPRQPDRESPRRPRNCSATLVPRSLGCPDRSPSHRTRHDGSLEQAPAGAQ
jgi:hypothetical protein